MKKVLIIAGAGIVLLVIIILLVVSCGSGGGEGPQGPVKLTYWRLFEDKSVFEPIFDSYLEKNKNIEINYIKKDSQEYYNELLDSLAAGSGPDIFMIRNDWLPAFKDKIATLPKDIMSQEEYKKTFVDVAANEIIDENGIYGIPFSVDALALIYNDRMLDDADCVQPPKNWNDFMDCTKKITKLSGKRINVSGAALGTSNNLGTTELGSKKLATDILSAMMAQNGTEMASADKSSASFGLPVQTDSGKTAYPGTNALDFYTSFARPNKETYSWHKNMGTSLDAFVNKTTAMIFGYSEQARIIESKNPNFAFYSSMMPQIKNSDNFKTTAYYWIEVVSKQSEHQKQSWNLLKYISSAANLSKYHSATKKPPSRKDMIESASGSTKYGAFAAQLKYATTWYKGKDPYDVYDIFAKMIDGVVSGQKTQNTIDAARNSVTALFQKQAE